MNVSELLGSIVDGASAPLNMRGNTLAYPYLVDCDPEICSRNIPPCCNFAPRERVKGPITPGLQSRLASPTPITRDALQSVSQ